MKIHEGEMSDRTGFVPPVKSTSAAIEFATAIDGDGKGPEH
jgi:hypothetical protein